MEAPPTRLEEDLPPDEPPPPPPLLVPAARELESFGWSWIVLAVALLAVALATGRAATLDVTELAILLVLLGLSTGSVLGALLLARRTGPDILYFRILDRAPPPPRGVPWETPGATTRRILPPAVGLVIGLVVAALVGAVVALSVGGQPRDGLGEDLSGATLVVAAVWTLVCGLAGLRMASYFTRWQRRAGGVVLCRPLGAGIMRPVYWVAPAEGEPRRAPG